MATRKRNSAPKEHSPFAQDLTGILLVAFAVFLLVSNFSSSTGLFGLYIVKLALRAILGVGIYILPFLIALYGVILLFRHEVKELTIRLTGLLISFLTFTTWVQFYAPFYFKDEAKYEAIQGAGGAIGFGLKFLLEKSIGAVGAYILLAALAIIACLMIFNVTVMTVVNFVKSLLVLRPKTADLRPKTRPAAVPVNVNEKIMEDTHSVAAQMPLIKELPAYAEASAGKPKEPVSFPIAEMMPEPEPRHEAKADKPTLTQVTEVSEKGEKRSYAKYKLPPLDLLEDPSSKEKAKQDKLKETTEMRKKLLEETLANFGVGARVVMINQGPAVTRYELQPDPGVKVSRIANLADDIALNLAAQGVRIEAPVPGKSVVGIEVPNTIVTPVRLKETVKSIEFQKNPSKLFVALGKDLSGMPIYGDIAKMPHLLVAGTTGSGKSVCINSLIISILLRARPDEVKFIMIDPKMVELSIYNDIPHLLAPVVTEPRRAALTLKNWVLKEMERRYKLFYDTGARNIDAYNRNRNDENRLPLIVVIVDELADLMMAAANEVETTICRLAQMSRATGIHLVIATQRPSVDVITGLIKANIPSRIAFAVATQIDSRVILDSSGAEKLLGRGDMLYSPVGAMKPVRLQGSFVTDAETQKVIDFIKEQAEPEYLEEIAMIKLPEGESSSTGETGEGGRDALFNEAVKLILESQIASTSYLQRRMRIGYNRAARLMDEIEAAGVVSKPEGENKIRKILGTTETLLNLK